MTAKRLAASANIICTTNALAATANYFSPCGFARWSKPRPAEVGQDVHTEDAHDLAIQ